VGNWQLDPYHTQVEFSAKHLGMMTVRGYFDELSTVADIDPDHPETSSVEATISTASLRTNNATRDNDIKSSHFLEVDKYPFIRFKSTSVEPSGQDHYKLTGDLTIKETTRPVVLDVVKYGEFNDPGMMGHRISYGAPSWTAGWSSARRSRSRSKANSSSSRKRPRRPAAETADPLRRPPLA
jgi:polyisoprenoid-binding protein YceI